MSDHTSKREPLPAHEPAADGRSLQLAFIRAARLHRQVVQARLSVKDVFPGQPHLMSLLAQQDGQRQKELAERLQITPATVNVMIGRMEKAGLLQRRADAADQRASRVFLTEKGRAVQEEIREEMAQIEAEAFAGFSDADRETMRGLLQRMHHNLKRAEGMN